MQDLRITLIQSDLHWENPEANRSMFEEKISALTTPGDIIVLPEMFTTGFTMNAAKLAEPMNFTSIKWMKQMAARTGSVITGSLIIQEEKKFFNRLIWMKPDGDHTYYDKRHLFRMADEHQTYSAGSKKIIEEWKGWRICPLICYDLRFPVWSRNQSNEYDVLIYVANWPQARSIAWKTLLQARAIENLCYVAGVNRVGHDGNSIYFSGDSAAISMKGEVLFQQSDQECIQTLTFSYQDLQHFRAKFPADKDADRFTIEP